jgi:GNAT superfamily N-acetyltransferase
MDIARAAHVEIRAAAPDDVPALVMLVEGYWRFERIDGFDRTRLEAVARRGLADPHLACAWLALVDGRPAGYVFIVFVYSLEYQGLTAEVDELFVLPAHRGHAVGARLLESAEAACRARGCTKMFLQLARENEDARRFYRRRGFAERDGYELLDKDLAGRSAG